MDLVLSDNYLQPAAELGQEETLPCPAVLYLSYRGGIFTPSGPACVLPVSLSGVRVTSVRKVEFPVLPTLRAGICI